MMIVVKVLKVVKEEHSVEMPGTEMPDTEMQAGLRSPPAGLRSHPPSLRKFKNET